MKLSKKLESDKTYNLSVVMTNKSKDLSFAIDVLVIGKDSELRGADIPRRFNSEYMLSYTDLVFANRNIKTYGGLMKELKCLNDFAKYYDEGLSVDHIMYVQECYVDNGIYKRKLEDLIVHNPNKGYFELYA